MLPKSISKKCPAVLDTNILLRFFLQDDKAQADAVEDLLKEAPFKSLELPDLIFTEIVFVLTSVYKLSKFEIIPKLHAILDFNSIRSNCMVLKITLNIFEKNNISFPDAYLSALVATKQNKLIYTFDKQLIKLNSKNARSP